MIIRFLRWAFKPALFCEDKRVQFWCSAGYVLGSILNVIFFFMLGWFSHDFFR